MKKLMTILAVFTMCGVAMAQDAQTVDPKKPIDLSMDKQTTTTTERQWVKGHMEGWSWVDGHYEDVIKTTTVQVPTTRDYLNVKEDGTLGKSGLNYTITASRDYNNYDNYEHQIAKGYFTVTSDVPANKVVAVQFLGAEMEDGSGNQTHQANNKIADYGIYLYDTATGKKTGDYLSVKDFNNYFDESAGITAGKSFGVYYQDNNGNIIASTGEGMKQTITGTEWYQDDRGRWRERYVTTLKEAENGMLGNFDLNSHELRVYDTNGNLTTPTTDKHFLCLSSGEYGEDSFQKVHWEFMLQTTIDNPYYPVNPNEFDGGVVIDDPVINGDVMTGQPLPGTLATLLIGGLCAGSLRKRNKK